MSSKHRRLRPRGGYQRPYGAAPTHSPAAPRSGRGKFITGLILVLAAGAIVYAVTRQKPATTATSTPPKPVATPKLPANGPRIECARTYDFGRAPADLPVDCVFTVTNTGTAMLEIPLVTPSCGCMKTNGWTRQVPPGQTGTISIRLDTAHYTGNFGKSVAVTCNDPTQTNFNVEIKGFIDRPLEFQPPFGQIYLAVNSEVTSNQTSIRLLGHLDGGVQVFDPKCTLPNIAVQLLTNEPGKDYQLLVRTIPPLPTSAVHGQISLGTSLPNMPTTNLALAVSYTPLVQATPYFLKLDPSPLPNAAEVSAWVRNNGTNVLTVSEAVVNAPGIKTSQEDDPANRGIRVTASFPAGFQTPAGTNLELVIGTTHPMHPVLKVPILQPQPTPAVAAPPKP